MTPKEKAKELIEKYEDQLPITCNQSSVQCAIIAVDEVIAYAKTFGDVTSLDIEEYELVKEELLKM